MLIAWILQLMNWLSCSQAVVDFSSTHNNQPTNKPSVRPTDRQTNVFISHFYDEKKNIHNFAVSSLVRILLNFSTAIDLFYKSVYLFFSIYPFLSVIETTKERKSKRARDGENERKGFVNALQAQISYDTFCSWHMISSDKLACGDFILCRRFFSLSLFPL